VKPLTNVPVPPDAAADPADQVTALYQAHALGLLRLAVITLGERQAAEDVVQDAFLGLFRRWGALNDPERALAYVRSSVFNGCRDVLRMRARNRQFVLADPKLAMFYQLARTGDGFPYSGPFTLAVYSVATGAVLRSWTGANPSHGSLGYGSNDLPDSNNLLTWTSNGQRLAFAYRNSNGPDTSLYLREVNLAGPRGSLFTDSTVAAKIAVSATNGRYKIWCDSLGITGDGRSAVCGAELPNYRHGTVTTVNWPGAVSTLLGNETAF
jgi:hypothetical protein